MKKFTVRRSKWARGGNSGDSSGGTALLNDAGFMCCLGFAACQISRKPYRVLLDAGFPSCVMKSASFLTELDSDGDVIDNVLTMHAVKINDNEAINDDERERQLKKLFRKHGVIVKFVD